MIVAAGAIWAALAFVAAGQTTGWCVVINEKSDTTYAARQSGSQGEDWCYSSIGEDKQTCLSASGRGCVWHEERGVCYKPSETSDDEEDVELEDDTCYKNFGRDKELCQATDDCTWQHEEGVCYTETDACYLQSGNDLEKCLQAEAQGCVWNEEDLACWTAGDNEEGEGEDSRRAFNCEDIGSDKEKCLEDEMQILSCAWGEETSTCFRQDRCWTDSGSDEEKCAEATALGLGCRWHPEEGCYSQQDAMDGCFARFGSDARMCQDYGRGRCVWKEERAVCHLAEKAETPPLDDWCYMQAGEDKAQCDALAGRCMFVESSAPPAPPPPGTDALVSSGCGTMLVVALGIAAFS
jgi:hypothetical protein